MKFDITLIEVLDKSTHKFQMSCRQLLSPSTKDIYTQRFIEMLSWDHGNVYLLGMEGMQDLGG